MCYCGLHVNFWKFWLTLFSFMIKKDHLKLKLLLWPQFPFNNTIKLNTRYLYELSTRSYKKKTVLQSYTDSIKRINIIYEIWCHCLYG